MCVPCSRACQFIHLKILSLLSSFKLIFHECCKTAKRLFFITKVSHITASFYDIFFVPFQIRKWFGCINSQVNMNLIIWWIVLKECFDRFFLHLVSSKKLPRSSSSVVIDNPVWAFLLMIKFVYSWALRAFIDLTFSWDITLQILTLSTDEKSTNKDMRPFYSFPFNCFFKMEPPFFDPEVKIETITKSRAYPEQTDPYEQG